MSPSVPNPAIPRSSQPGWRLLEWDSAFFGFRIARANEAEFAAVPNRTVEECAQQGVRCLYFLADAGDLPVIRKLEQQRFQFADIRLTLLRKTPDASEKREFPSIRPARAEDVPA